MTVLIAAFIAWPFAALATAVLVGRCIALTSARPSRGERDEPNRAGTGTPPARPSATPTT